MVDRILKILLLLSPLVYFMGIDLNIVDLIFFRLGVIVLFCASLFDKPKRNINIALPISLIMGLCLFNLFTHAFNQVVFSYTLNIFLALMALSIIVNYASPLDKFRKWIIGAVAINIIVFIAQKFGFSPIIQNPQGEPGGILGNAPRFIDYLTLTLAVVCSYSLWFIIPLLIISLIVKEYTLLGIAVIYLFLKIKNKVFRISLVGTSFIGMILLHKQIIFSLVNVRWLVWKPTIEAIFQNPLGYGLGLFPQLSSQFIKTNGYQVEFVSNSYLEFIFGAGLLELALIFWGVNKFIKRFDLSIEALSVLSILLLSCLEYPLEIPKLWFTIIALTGFYIIKQKGANDVSPQ